MNFAAPPIGINEEDFFRGLSQFIPERCTPKADPLGAPYSEDGCAGMELMLRKINLLIETIFTICLFALSATFVKGKDSGSVEL